MDVYSYILYIYFAYLACVLLWCVKVHFTLCLWSLRSLQCVSFSPAADGSCSPCAACGFYKHLQGTGNCSKEKRQSADGIKKGIVLNGVMERAGLSTDNS